MIGSLPSIASTIPTRRSLPPRQRSGVGAHLAGGGEQGHLAGLRQRAVPGELAGSYGGGRGRGGIVEQVAVDRGCSHRGARDQRGQAQPDAAGAHLRQGGGGQTAPGVIGKPVFAAVEFRQRQGQVALVAQRVPGEVEVAVHDQLRLVRIERPSRTAACVIFMVSRVAE